MPFVGGFTGGGRNFKDVLPLDGVPDEANRLMEGDVVVTVDEIKQAEADIDTLEEQKMNKTDPIDGGSF